MIQIYLNDDAQKTNSDVNEEILATGNLTFKHNFWTWKKGVMTFVCCFERNWNVLQPYFLH